MVATNSGSVVPSWMWPTTAEASAASAKRLEADKKIHEGRAAKYRVAASQLSESTEGAMSEAMITEHQLLAVDHTNIARILDEYIVAETTFR